MRISDFVGESNRLTCREDVVGLMERAAADFGFDRYAYCALTRHDDYEHDDHPAPAVALNFPSSWTDYYFENDYPSKDPVMLHAPELDRPFLWEWMTKAYSLSEAQRRLMHEAREARLRDGVGVPLHGPCGDVCLVTFAAGDGHPDAESFLPALGFLAAQFHAAYSEVGRTDSDDPVPSLSERERECLKWIALGKTSGDIGAILGISENTVNFHIKNAFRKLETNSRIAAVVKAIRYGFIAL